VCEWHSCLPSCRTAGMSSPPVHLEHVLCAFNAKNHVAARTCTAGLSGAHWHTRAAAPSYTSHHEPSSPQGSVLHPAGGRAAGATYGYSTYEQQPAWRQTPAQLRRLRGGGDGVDELLVRGVSGGSPSVAVRSPLRQRLHLTALCPREVSLL